METAQSVDSRPSMRRLRTFGAQLSGPKSLQCHHQQNSPPTKRPLQAAERTSASDALVISLRSSFLSRSISRSFQHTVNLEPLRN